MNSTPPVAPDDYRRAGAADDPRPPLPRSYERRDAAIDFAKPVARNGYLWWYLDAISDDGQQALTLIIFVGSVFSPYYARARRREMRDAEQHCAFNTILYGPGSRKRWSMTERSAQTLQRDRDSFHLGPSHARWDGTQLSVAVDELCVPFPRRMRGSIRLTPSTLTEHTLILDTRGRHRWHPLAPIARVDVDFPGLGVRWSGHGYLDSNEGQEPLADGFLGWDWTRARLPGGDCAIRYEAREPMRQPHKLALRFGADGSIRNEPTSSSMRLPKTSVWQISRRMPGAEGEPQIRKTLEDTPFYARSIVEADFAGERGLGFHESLCMQRFEKRWVQALLPFRMPRFD